MAALAFTAPTCAPPIFNATPLCAGSPLRERLRRKPILRTEQVVDAARAWGRLMPQMFRVGETRMMRTHHELVLVEDRITSSWLIDERCDDGERERGVSVCRLLLAVHKGKLRQHWRPFAAVSLHGLARRIERGRDSSHLALTADLARLVEAEATEGDHVDTVEPGFWVGKAIATQDETSHRAIRLRSVRTWVSRDNIA